MLISCADDFISERQMFSTAATERPRCRLPRDVPWPERRPESTCWSAALFLCDACWLYRTPHRSLLPILLPIPHHTCPPSLARSTGTCSAAWVGLPGFQAAVPPPGVSSHLQELPRGPGGGWGHCAHPHLLASADNPRDPGALCLGHLTLDTHPCTLLLCPALHWLQYDPSCCGYLPAGPLPAFRILEHPRSAPSSGSPAPSKPLANGLNPLSFGKGVSLTF